MKVWLGILAILACVVVSGCKSSEVSNQDAENWAQAHDSKGNPIPDQPSQDGR